MKVTKEAIIESIVHGMRKIRPYFRKLFTLTTDFSNLEMLILTILMEREGKKIMMSELKEILYPLSFSKLSVITNKLENDKLIRKVKDQKDRRKVEVRLTPKGMKKYEQFEKEVSEFIAEGLEALNEEEVKTLLNSFDIWVKLLKRGLEKKIEDYSREVDYE